MAHKTEPQPIPIESQEAGYELRDTPLLPIVIGFVSTAILLFSSVIATVVLLGYFESNNQSQSHEVVTHTLTMPQEEVVVPKEAMLQVNPERDLAVYKAESESMLNGYGWVDSDAGRVHIPIEQAMDLALERDLLQVREE
jgi:hypothetical protein